MNKKIYICIPVFNRISYTLKCLGTILEQGYKNYEIIVCDDGSTDGTSEIIASQFPEVVIINGDGNLWWTGGINECVKYVLKKAGPEDYIFTLNNDTELAPDTLKKLIEFGESYSDSLIACGNYFINDKNKLESTAFVKKGTGLFSEHHRPLFPWGQQVSKLQNTVYEVNSVSGKGVLIPIPVFNNIGLYNSDKLPHYHADTEFSRRAFNFGYKIYFNLSAIIYTDPRTTGIGQVNSEVSVKEFFNSFFSLRSDNHLRSLYNRSKIFYGRKWIFYLIPNISSKVFSFLKRYSTSIKEKVINKF